MACGNPNNPVPRARSKSQTQDTPSSTLKTPPADVNGIDWLSQSGSQLDPLIFGEYREAQDTGEFGGFFDDAFPVPDLGDYNNDQQKRNTTLPELDDKFDDDDEVVPGEDPSSLLNCNKIWSVKTLFPLRVCM